MYDNETMTMKVHDLICAIVEHGPRYDDIDNLWCWLDAQTQTWTSQDPSLLSIQQEAVLCSPEENLAVTFKLIEHLCRDILLRPSTARYFQLHALTGYVVEVDTSFRTA